jgi:Ca2+-binding EF-hand superfamily protein
MNKLGTKISGKELDEIMLKHDQTKNNMLDFEEFKAIFNECE